MDAFLKRYFDKMIIKTMILAMLVSVVTALTLFYFHTQAQQEMLSTEIHNRSRAAGNSIARLIETALQLGIPFDAIPGVNDFLNGNLKNAQELDYIAVTDVKGTLLYHTNNFKSSIRGSFKRFSMHSHAGEEDLPSFNVYQYHNIPLRIKQEKETAGYLHLGVSQKATKEHIDEIYYDILTILLVSMVIGFEFLIFIFRNSVTKPVLDLLETMKRITFSDYKRTIYVATKDVIGKIIINLNVLIRNIVANFHSLERLSKDLQKNQAGGDRFLMINEELDEIKQKCTFPEDNPEEQGPKPIVENLRLPAFLIVLAETILVTILPSYAAQFYDPSFYFSKQFISGTPIFVFMIFALLSIPLTTPLSYRFGFQKTILIGSFISASGYFMSYFGDSLTSLLINRAITAVGYGICYTTCQNYIAAYAPAERRIQSYAIFSVAFAAAYICGAPIGGILVDNIGYSFTFLLAGFASVIALIMTYLYIVDFSKLTMTAKRITKKRPLDLFKNHSITSFVFLTVLPARLMFTSLICFLSPIYLRQLGNTQSTAGRIIMIFGVISFFISPMVAKCIANRSAWWLLFFSSLCIGAALFINALVGTTWGAMLSLAIYALGYVVHTGESMVILESIAQQEFENHTKGDILGFYIFFERMGMIIGPMLASLLLAKFDFYLTFYNYGNFPIDNQPYFLGLLAI